MISAAEALELVEGVRRTRRALIEKIIEETLKKADKVVRSACHFGSCEADVSILKNDIPETFTVEEVTQVANKVVEVLIDLGFTASYENVGCGTAVAFNVFINWSLGDSK